MNGPLQDRKCFCCGPDNPHGLHLKYQYPVAGTAETEFSVPSRFTGWQQTVHGGLLAMVLDETMAHACISAGRNGLTAEMKVRYRLPVQVDARLKAKGWVAADRGKLIETGGALTNDAGQIVAEATGRFFAPVSPAVAAGPTG